MEIVHIANQTKLNETRITKGIGAFLIISSQSIEAFSNETITCWIEQNDGNNIDISKSVKISHFILGSVFGDTTINGSNGGTMAVCELANEGNISLDEGESIKFKLDGLKSAQTYTIHGLEYPVESEALVTWDRKTVLQGEITKELGISPYNEMIIENADVIQEIEFIYSNGRAVKYPLAELKMMAYEMDNFLLKSQDGTIVSEIPNTLVLDVTHMVSMEVQKDTTKELPITFRTVAETIV